MNAIFVIEPVPENLFGVIAERSRDMCERMRSQFVPVAMEGRESTWILSTDQGDAPSPGAQLYAFSLRVLSHAIVGNATNATEGPSSIPAITTDYVRQLAIEGRLVKPEPDWVVPTVEHTWTAEMSRIDKLAEEFSESFYADP